MVLGTGMISTMKAWETLWITDTHKQTNKQTSNEWDAKTYASYKEVEEFKTNMAYKKNQEFSQRKMNKNNSSEGQGRKRK